MKSRMSSPASDSAGIDRLTTLLTQFSVSAALLDADPLLRFPRRYGSGGVADGSGHLHVLWEGELDLVAGTHRENVAGRRVRGPAVLLHAAGGTHELIPAERPAVTCAAVTFAHGAEHPLVRALPPTLVVDTSQLVGLSATLELLREEVQHVRCGQPLVAARLLEVLVLQVLRWALGHPDVARLPDGLVRGMSDPAIAAALVAVHDAPGAPWTLERMARTAAVSRSVFAERFRRLVGTTPAAYLSAYRMALVQDRLRAGEQVGTIAAELGYANGSGLSRAFTAQFGMSPTAWLAANA